MVVHGVDVNFSGTNVELDKMRKRMGAWYDIKKKEWWEVEMERSRW